MPEVEPCLKSLGYTIGGYQNEYSNATVCSSLRNGGIVIVSGVSAKGGHAWVIDGCVYKKTREEYYTRPVEPMTLTWTLDTFLEKSVWYVHFNYGWGGLNSVWVLSAAYDFGRGSILINREIDQWTRTIFADPYGAHNQVGIIPNICPNK